MKVVTCISDPENYGYKYYLKPSCSYHKLELISIEFSGKWSTHRIKDLCLLAYVKELPPDEIIFFTDGYDTLLTCSAKEILEKYRQFQKPIVFTAERNCWPYAGLSGKFPLSASPARYLNCGGFIGPAGAIAFLLRKYPSPPSSHGFFQKINWRIKRILSGKESDPDNIYKWSNQYYWSHVFLENQDMIALDYNSEIFLELAPALNELMPNLKQFRAQMEESPLYKNERSRIEADCRFMDHRLLYAPTQTTPCQVHFNSPVTKQIALNGHFRQIMPWMTTFQKFKVL